MLIYKITNRLNGKVYIGKWQGKDARTRWNKHLTTASTGGGFYLHNALRKYGPEQFSFEVIATAESKIELAELEREFIATHCSNNPEFGYNLTQGGEGGKQYPGERNSFFGKHHSDETKRKLAEKARKQMTGVRRSNSTRQAISASLKQYKRTDEHSKHISEAKKGKPGRTLTEQEKARLRDFKRQWWAVRKAQ